jgi:hypothetical protein
MIRVGQGKVKTKQLRNQRSSPQVSAVFSPVLIEIDTDCIDPEIDRYLSGPDAFHYANKVKSCMKLSFMHIIDALIFGYHQLPPRYRT